MKRLLTLILTIITTAGFAQDINVRPVFFVKDSTRDYTWKFNNRLLRYTSGFTLTDSTAHGDTSVSYRYQKDDLRLSMTYTLRPPTAGLSGATGEQVIDYIAINGDLPTLLNIFNGLMRLELTAKMLTRRKGIIGKIHYTDGGPVHYYSFNPVPKSPAEWYITFF